MTNGGLHTAFRTRMARSNPSSAQYQLEVMGCGAPIGKAKTPPGRSARYTPSNSAGRPAGRKCPSAPKRTARPKAPAKGRARGVGPYPPGVRVRTARLREHARAGAAAHVQSRAERAEWAQRVGGRVKHAIGGA